MKRKRARPIDQRKLPEIRAHLEVAKKHGLKFPLSLGFKIFWDCAGDWDRVEQWFRAPKVQAQNQDQWLGIKAGMNENRQFLDRLFQEALGLYQRYSTSPSNYIH